VVKLGYYAVLFFQYLESEVDIMLEKEDLRIVKTKHALNKAFFEMLRETSIENITVNDLCEHAGIRRATFYKHFNDKIDFITYLICAIRDKFDREYSNDFKDSTPTVDYYLKYVAALGEFLSEHEEAINRILNSSMRATFISIFMQRNYLDTSERLAISKQDGMNLPASVPVVSCMLTGGISYNLIRWFETEDRPPIDSLLIEISKFIQTVLK